SSAYSRFSTCFLSFFFQAEDGIRGLIVTGVQTCALPISNSRVMGAPASAAGSRPPTEETGDPGSELRMRAAVPEDEDYTHAPRPLRQYRARLPGPLAQLLPHSRQENP